MPITPDTKDWTWVLKEPCAECGFHAGEFPAEQVGQRLRDDLPRWQAVLAKPDAGVRPNAAIWSATEYACHCRDVCDLFVERLTLMLTQDNPQFANWDQDQTAIDSDYTSQLAAPISEQLAVSFSAAADAFDAVPDDAWERPGTRSNGSVFTSRTLAQYFLHDLVHHLHDVDG
ncbi:MAG: DinB family protein [Aeromicrobium sp.]